jgi:hypothetical protein
MSEKSIQTSDTNPADAFRNMFAILHNLGLADLNRAQVITDGNPLNNKQWDRFNDDLTTFVLKLDDARLDALWALVNDRQPERYRHRPLVAPQQDCGEEG